MNIIRSVGIATTCVFVAGCIPNKYQINYVSYPPGAVITEGGKVWGRAPIGIIYNNPNRKWDAVANGVKCTWKSGATVDTGKIKVDISTGNVFTANCNRPSDYPNLDMDIEVGDAINANREAAAQRQQQTNLQGRQTGAAEGSMLIQELEYIRGK